MVITFLFGINFFLFLFNVFYFFRSPVLIQTLLKPASVHTNPHINYDKNKRFSGLLLKYKKSLIFLRISFAGVSVGWQLQILSS